MLPLNFLPGLRVGQALDAFFAFITAKLSPLTHAGSPTCPLLKKKGKNVSHARTVIFFFFFVLLSLPEQK